MSVSPSASGSSAARAVSRPQESPLSYAQETMLFWDRMVPRSAVYNVPIALHLRGRLDISALRRAIRLVFSRHEVLRSHFLFTEDDPVQVVGPIPNENSCLSVIDRSERSSSTEPIVLKQIVNSEAQRPFHLANDVMLRAALFRVSETQHVLLFNMHHVASDGWSLGTLLGEISEAYLAFSQGREPLLVTLSAQYSDFARWQREFLDGPAKDRLLSFWRQYLDGAPELSDLLPLDRPRPEQQVFTGAVVRMVLPNSVVPALIQLGQTREATLFMVMLAALQLLLGRNSGKSDIPVGVPVANRKRTEFLGLIGCFMNMVVVRSDLSGNPSFLDLLTRVRESSLQVLSHPELPFSELVRHLHPKRNAGYTPFFQVQFAFQNFPMPAIIWPGVDISRFAVETGSSKFDLSVAVEQTDGLELQFEYNSHLFEAKTIKRLLEHYTFLLQEIAVTPEKHLEDFQLGAAAGLF